MWHGTSRLDPHIVYADRMDGFMMQFAANGLWGRGIYFADKAVYSKHYSHKPAFCETSKRERPGAKKDELEMFLTRLTIGEYQIHIDPISVCACQLCHNRTHSSFLHKQEKKKSWLKTGH